MPVSHSDNLYTTTVVEDANIYDPTDAPELSSVNQYPFYLMEIVPKNLGVDLVCAGNFTINGLSSSWSWNAINNNHDTSNECNPPMPPWRGVLSGQHITHSTPHNINMQDTSPNPGQGAYTCYGADSITGVDFNGNDARAHQGPFFFHNLAYIGSQFSADQIPVTWYITILIDVYELNDGTLINDNLSPSVEENLSLWSVGNNYDLSNMKHNGHPVKVKAFIMPYYSTENGGDTDLSPGLNEIEFDLDYIIPVSGCLDNNADNYDPLAQISDPSSCTYPQTYYTVNCYDSGDVTGTTADEGDVTTYIDPPFATEVPAWDVFSLYPTRDLSGLPAMPKNLLIGNGPMPGAVYLQNSYSAGDQVDEIIEITLRPRKEVYGTGNFSNGTPPVEIMGTAMAIFDFPDIGGPTAQTIDPDDPLVENYDYFGESWHNLTAGSVYIKNYDSDLGAEIGRGQYIPINNNGQIISNTSTGSQPQWLPATGIQDENGNNISTLVEWYYADSFECVQVDGTVFDIGAVEIWAEEIYTTSNNTLSRYPATEWWPVKVKLYLKVDFIMPASNVQIVLDLIHDNVRVAAPRL